MHVCVEVGTACVGGYDHSKRCVHAQTGVSGKSLCMHVCVDMGTYRRICTCSDFCLK
jgi:hypothetical protein